MPVKLRKDLEYRCLTHEFRVEGEESKPVIVGHAAVFNSLSENLGGFRELIKPGAFDEVIKDDVRALFNHNEDLVLGRTTAGTLRLSIDERGLHYEIDPPDTQLARDLLISMRRGDVNRSSFAFGIDRDGQEWSEDDEGRVIRTIHNFKRLHDVSPVTFPAYQAAESSIRSLQEFKEEQEKQRRFARREIHKRKFWMLSI
jgi:HK97 family phage prohead protease